MNSLAAQEVISARRGDAAVVMTFTAAHEWPQVSRRADLDFTVSIMGKASSLGLGLALAQPRRKVIVLDGDGSLLMNLGSLVTIAHAAPPNLIHFLFENGVYRTTGGQGLPNEGRTDFVEVARAAGYRSVHRIRHLAELREGLGQLLDVDGPVFASLVVERATQRSASPLARCDREMVERFTAALR